MASFLNSDHWPPSSAWLNNGWRACGWGPQHGGTWLGIVVVVPIVPGELPGGLWRGLGPFAPYFTAPGYCTWLGQWLLFKKTKTTACLPVLTSFAASCHFSSMRLFKIHPPAISNLLPQAFQISNFS